ncbi:MAG TPA: WXG100 family type VII secretion target [Ktedonobacterales bacterium]|nr:WXG100 family type VII secretion target [Ktedonobacterales bacterium]
MKPTRANTDLMRQLAAMFETEGKHIYSIPTNQIHLTIFELGLTWRGASRQRFDQLFAQWQKNTQHATQLSHQIAQHLEQTASKLDEEAAASDE